MARRPICFEPEAFDAVVGWERFLELAERRAALATEIRAATEVRRRRVEEQYHSVLGARTEAR